MKKPTDYIKEVEVEIGIEVEALTSRPANIISGLVGNVMEWYDFALYGYMVPIVSQLFFPNDNILISAIATFGVFAAGFLMRPLGGFVLGRLGDIKGRKFTLYASLILMAISTSLMGLLPTHQAVGILAPILLVTLRLVQGLSVGGEFSTSVTYMVEEAPSSSRGIFGSFANIGSVIGMALGAGVAALVTTILSDSAVQEWGWRLPFFFAAILGVIGLYYTKQLPESHLFLREKRHEKVASVREIMSKGRSVLIKGAMFCTGHAVFFYLPLVYMPTYVSLVAGMDVNKALQIVTLSTLSLVVFIPLMAMISDKFIKRRTLLIIAFSIGLVVSIPFFLLATKSYTMLLVVQLLFVLMISIPLGVAPTTLVELFPTKYRLTGYSVVFNLGIGIFGGSAPLISTWLINLTGNNTLPAIYLCFTILITIIGLVTMRDHSREPLR